MARLGGRLFVTLPGNDSVVALDVTDGGKAAAASPGRGPLAMVVHNGQLIVGNLTDSTVAWLAPRTLAVAATEPVTNPAALQVDGEELFIGSVQDPSVTTMDLPTRRVTRRTGVPRFSGVMSVSADGVVVATYDRTPQLLVLDRHDLNVRVTRQLPSQVYDMVLIDGAAIVAVPEDRALTRLPLAIR
jgi:hypothetical protein